MNPASPHCVNHAGDTHCQANPPVIPSRSRSLRLRCLEGMVSSGLMGGPPPPPPAPLPPPENNAIPSDNVESIYTCDTPRDLLDLSTSQFHIAYRTGMIADDVSDAPIFRVTVRNSSRSRFKYLRFASRSRSARSSSSGRSARRTLASEASIAVITRKHQFADP